MNSTYVLFWWIVHNYTILHCGSSFQCKHGFANLPCLVLPHTRTIGRLEEVGSFNTKVKKNMMLRLWIIVIGGGPNMVPMSNTCQVKGGQGPSYNTIFCQFVTWSWNS